MNKWQSIPEELRVRNQWLLAGPDKEGNKKIPSSLFGRACPNNDKSLWLSFEVASEAALKRGWNIGFCLSSSDPFCIVDFDVRDKSKFPNNPERWTTREQTQQIDAIAKELNTYVEVSQSGKGLHVIGLANIGEGVRDGDSGVEIYSQDRFMVCTGDAYVVKPLADIQEVISAWTLKIRKSRAEPAVLVEVESTLTDAEVLQKCNDAADGEKFRALWSGQYEGFSEDGRFPYPTGSEADSALIWLLAFVSCSNAQVRRIFRSSPLCARVGKSRPMKHFGTDYDINRNIAAYRAMEEAKNAEKAAIAAGAEKIQAAYKEKVAEVQRAAEIAKVDFSVLVEKALTEAYEERKKIVIPVEVPDFPMLSASVPPIITGECKFDLDVSVKPMLDWPPGFMGKIARQIYDTSPRPVKEISIASAMALMAGICGKAWQTRGSGLNLYILVIAQSGVGKEALFSGMDNIARAVSETYPCIRDFIADGQLASGPAITSLLAKKSSVISKWSEFGDFITRAGNKRDINAQTILQTVTGMYQKSGFGSATGGGLYKNEDDNIVGPKNGAAFSMACDTTPDKLYNALTYGMQADGFLSRFIFVDYNGLRPAANENLEVLPANYVDPEVSGRVGDITHYANKKIVEGKFVSVSFNQDMSAASKFLDKATDAKIDAAGSDEAERQKWNRLHLNVIKCACLLAVVENYSVPVVTLEHLTWAYNFVLRTVCIFNEREASGMIGNDDSARLNAIKNVLLQYSSVASGKYKIPEDVKAKGIVSHSYLLLRCQRLAAFREHSLGAAEILKRLISTCVTTGMLSKKDAADMRAFNQFGGDWYQISPTIFN